MKSNVFALAFTFVMALLSAAHAGVIANGTKRDNGYGNNGYGNGNNNNGYNNGKDVFNPQIYAPTQGAVWTIGTQQAVEWDTSNAPYQVTNNEGKIVLAKDYQMFTNEQGGLYNPLACDFSIFDGVAYVTVPYVEPGYDYQIVLFGDSGNFSPTFTISY